MSRNNVISPLTGSKNTSLINRYSKADLVTSWQSVFNIDIENDLHEIESIDLYSCNDTGLRFFLPLKSAGGEKMYSLLQEFPWYYSTNKWEYDRASEDLRNASNLLEIGCGTGAFLNIAKKQGIKCNGIEFNSRAISAAQSQGLQVEKISLEEVIQRGQRYDAVCAFQVLEHVPNPREFLMQLISLLNPKGILILAIPNGDSYLRLQQSLLDRPPHHLTQWTKLALLSLPRLFPITLERLIPEPLSPLHIQDCFNSIYLEFHHRSVLHKLTLNRFTKHFFIQILRLFRSQIYGHSWYVSYRLNDSIER